MVCQPFGQPVPIGDMDGESFLENPEQPLCLPRVLVSSLKRSDDLTLAVDAALRPLNAQLGVFQMLFQVRRRGIRDLSSQDQRQGRFSARGIDLALGW